MDIATHWIKAAPVIGGQDHLGTQAPSESIYTSLLPGITNVTNRARYYSFYPWFLWRFEQRSPGGTPALLEMMLRRAECLFGLIGARHGALQDARDEAHGAGMVGRDVLVPALFNLRPDSRLTLSTYATSIESDDRYFMNRLGGLAQYYFGPLRDLGILGGDLRRTDVRYTQERGLPLARAFAAVDPDDTFFKLLDADEVTLADLDGLASLCPCRLHDNEVEYAALVDLLVDPETKMDDESRARRCTLTLLLAVAARGRGRPNQPLEDEFRASVYAVALPAGTRWEAPGPLAQSLQAWASYQRNELLSVALQGLFWAALESAVASGRARLTDTDELADLFLTTAVAKAIPADHLHESFSSALERRKAELPPLEDWLVEGHEMSAASRLFVATSAKKHGGVVTESLAILLALIARNEGDDPYAACLFEPGYLDRYPLNLCSLLRRSRGEWAPMSLREVIGRLTVWTIEVHFRVALQKLAASPARDTFKVRPLDGELRVVGAPPPVYTSPRVQRAVGMLHDLGFLHRKFPGGRSELTLLGEKIIGVLHG
jgi:hypothetical protein